MEAGTLQRLPASPTMVTAESPASRVSHITLGRKRAGKPSAENRHDCFEVARAGTQLTVWLKRRSQRKRGRTDGLNFRSMAPVLDPTRKTQYNEDRPYLVFKGKTPADRFRPCARAIRTCKESLLISTTVLLMCWQNDDSGLFYCLIAIPPIFARWDR